MCDEGRARQQSAAAAGDQQQVEFADLVDQFQRRGALAGDDGGVVVRWDQRQAALLGQSATDVLTRLMLGVVFDHLSAVVSRRRLLYGGRVGGHHDRPRDAEEPTREGDGLRVIPRGVRDHAAALLVWGEP